MKTSLLRAMTVMTVGSAWALGKSAQLSAQAAATPAQKQNLDRTVLPIPQPVTKLITEPDV